MYVNNMLIKPSLHNIITVADYSYNCLAKQHVSASLGHHHSYKTVELVKVHSVAFTYGISWVTILLFLELQVLFNLLTPNVNYSGRTAPLTSKVSFYIFIQQI